MSPVDVAYIAGLLDGEGFIGVEISRRKDCSFGYWIRPLIKLGLSISDSDVIYWMKSLLKMGSISNTGSHKNGYRALSFDVRHRDEVKTLTELVLPFSKVPSAKKKLMLLKKIIDLRPRYKRLNREEFRELANLVSELRKLNKKKGPKRVPVEDLFLVP